MQAVKNEEIRRKIPPEVEEINCQAVKNERRREKLPPEVEEINRQAVKNEKRRRGSTVREGRNSSCGGKR